MSFDNDYFKKLSKGGIRNHVCEPGLMNIMTKIHHYAMDKSMEYQQLKRDAKSWRRLRHLSKRKANKKFLIQPYHKRYYALIKAKVMEIIALIGKSRIKKLLLREFADDVASKNRLTTSTINSLYCAKIVVERLIDIRVPLLGYQFIKLANEIATICFQRSFPYSLLPLPVYDHHMTKIRCVDCYLTKEYVENDFEFDFDNDSMELEMPSCPDFLECKAGEFESEEK